MNVHQAFRRSPGQEVTLSVFQTENGSALHEAALFGKMDVVRLLLGSGEFRGVQRGSEGLRWVPLQASPGLQSPHRFPSGESNAKADALSRLDDVISPHTGVKGSRWLLEWKRPAVPVLINK